MCIPKQMLGYVNAVFGGGSKRLMQGDINIMLLILQKNTLVPT